MAAAVAGLLGRRVGLRNPVAKFVLDVVSRVWLQFLVIYKFVARVFLCAEYLGIGPRSGDIAMLRKPMHAPHTRIYRPYALFSR